jgi:hypothetical protein
VVSLFCQLLLIATFLVSKHWHVDVDADVDVWRGWLRLRVGRVESGVLAGARAEGEDEEEREGVIVVWCSEFMVALSISLLCPFL